MKLYQEYFLLNYLNENKWKELLRAGKLSTDDLRRIQKSKGLVKPAKDWLNSVDKGSNNILKKYNTKLTRSGDLRKGDGMFSPNDNEIYLPNINSRKDRPDDIIIKRHEAWEDSLSHSKLKNSTSVKRYSTMGNHQSDEVLRREKELINTNQKLYGKKSNPVWQSNYRELSGEYENLGSKKEILKHDKKLNDVNIEISKLREKRINLINTYEKLKNHIIDVLNNKYIALQKENLPEDEFRKKRMILMRADDSLVDRLLAKFEPSMIALNNRMDQLMDKKLSLMNRSKMLER